jgi:LL-diaminopimelate aminotransferase
MQALKENPHLQLIDMGVGEPDLPADPQIVSVLSTEAGKSENRFYADNGIPEFQFAVADFMKKVYNVEIENPLKNIIHSIGSKPALALLPLCFINPGDIALITIPGYPVMGTYVKYLGGETYPLPLTVENNFYPNFEAIPKALLKRVKMLYINYPDNPTGQIATTAFYEKVVAFAKENHIVVVADAAYSALTFDNCEPLSFLSVPGACDVGVEVHSMSKSFNMTGWRLAFLVGNEKIIKAFASVKDNTDSGQFRAIQKAGVYALNNLSLLQTNRDRYSRRMNLLVDKLTSLGFNMTKPKATFYCYVPAFKAAKDGSTFTNAEECSEYLIKKALISTVPWDDAAAFLRFSVTFEADNAIEEKRVIDEMGDRLARLGLIF